MTSYFVQEVTDAIRALLDGAALTFAPKLVMAGGLEYYPEAADISDDLPAVFIESLGMESELADVGGFQFDQVYRVRVVVLDKWTDGDVVHTLKTGHAKEVWDLLVASGLDFSASISGLTIESAVPTMVDMQPPEELAANYEQARRIFAIAIEAELEGKANT